MSKRHTDKYIPRSETVGAANAVIKASNWREDGWNGAAILERVKFMKRVIQHGLVAPEYRAQALDTIENLERQL